MRFIDNPKIIFDEGVFHNVRVWLKNINKIRAYDEVLLYSAEIYMYGGRTEKVTAWIIREEAIKDFIKYEKEIANCKSISVIAQIPFGQKKLYVEILEGIEPKKIYTQKTEDENDWDTIL